MKYLRKLRVTLHACKGNAAVRVKEESTTRCTSIQLWELSSSTKPPVDSCLCVNVMEALLEVLKKGAPRDACVLVHARKAWEWVRVCVCVCHLQSPADSSCVCA